MRNWRVFYTNPRAEIKCEERLLEKDIDVFLPKYVVESQWKDRKRKVTKPLFSSYIFANVDEKERIRVLESQGVSRCLSFGGELAEVSDEEITQLKIAQNTPHLLGTLGHWLPPLNQTVLINAGPLQGLTGEVYEHRGSTYVMIRVESIRQVIKVQVPAEWVKIDSAPN